jgi:hypothetical protein
VRSETAIVSWGLSRPIGLLTDVTERELADQLRTWAFQARVSPGVNTGLLGSLLDSFMSCRRIVYRQCWERQDPVTQLVPGETTVKTVQLTTGVTDEALREFSSSVGLGASASVVDLSAHLTTTLSSKISLSVEVQTTSTLQLSNSREGFLRRVAVWYLVHLVSVDRVAYGSEPDLPVPDEIFVWQPLTEIEFADMSALQTTYFDIAV